MEERVGERRRLNYIFLRTLSSINGMEERG
jgi:hypothetical protein